MSCEKIKTMIPLFLDGELDVKESQQVREHLPGCAACQKELKAYEQSWAMLDHVEDIQPKPGYVSRFWTMVSKEQSSGERILQGIKESLLKRPLAPAFVTACVIVSVGLFALRNYLQIQDTGRMLASLGEDELEMVQNIELAENFDLIQEIDFFEDLEIIENLDVLET